ncbi:hypothetical protein Thermo_00828 [Thermoplasmatales archaeon]|nr:hypothetical protein Thermo_00828 [Thermoplasmatales archaeon]
MAVFSLQRIYSESFLQDFLASPGCNISKHTADKLLSSTEMQQPLVYHSRGSGNLISELSQWRYLGLNSGTFSVEEVNGGKHIRYIETRADNLGRLYLQFDDLINEGKLKDGREYILSGRIGTVNVTTKTVTDKFGAVVGVAYVDDAGWTPRRDAFQCEIGFVGGTNEETEYRSRFVLGAMPPGCTSLILYLVNVVGVGEAYFSDIKLAKAGD